eukprot:COSAG01_NODE_12785_length_1686_cov_1.109011_2_plen_67_part_00
MLAADQTQQKTFAALTATTAVPSRNGSDRTKNTCTATSCGRSSGVAITIARRARGNCGAAGAHRRA